VKEVIQPWVKNGFEIVNIVVAGNHGVGKTTLVSALCDKPLPAEQPPEIIELYNRSITINGDIVVWDACVWTI